MLAQSVTVYSRPVFGREEYGVPKRAVSPQNTDQNTRTWLKTRKRF